MKNLSLRAVFALLLFLGLGFLWSVNSIRAQQGLARSGSSEDSSSEAAVRRALEYFTLATDLEASESYSLAYIMYDSAHLFDQDSDDIRLGLARSAFKLGRLEDALFWTDDIIPREAGVCRLLIDIYRAKENVDSTIAYVRQLVALDPSEINGRFLLASFLERQNKIDSAENLLSEAAILTQDYRTWRQVGVFRLQLSQPDSAFEAFRRSIALEPAAINLGAYGGAADALGLIGDSAGMRRYLDGALAIDSNYAPLRRKLVDYFVDKNMIDSALPHAEAVVRITPQDHQAREQMALIAFNAKRYDIARDGFEALVSSGDQRISNYYYLGRIHYATENFPAAVKNFRQVTIGADTLVDGWIGMGLSYHEMDSLESEIAVYREALSHVTQKEGRLNLQFSLGAANERAGKIKESEVAFLEAIAIEPKHAPSLNYLGYMILENGDRLDYATELIVQALVESPNNAAYLDSYGWALYLAGNYSAALDTLRRALPGVGSDATVLDHLGDAFGKMHMPDSALIYWRKALAADTTNATIRAKIAPDHGRE